MTEPTPIRPTLVDKPPRPQHVIALTEVLRALEKEPKVETLLVAYYLPTAEGGRSLRWDVQGTPDEMIALCARLQNVLVNEEWEEVPPGERK